VKEAKLAANFLSRKCTLTKWVKLDHQ